MTARPTVLLVDDDAGIRGAMAKRLADVGFDVHAVTCGAEALASIRSTPIDAALIDVKMPDIDGFAVCEHIRKDEACKHIPVFMLTGTSDNVVRNFLGTLTSTVGGNHYVTKPCDGKAVAQAMWDAVQGQRTSTQS